MEPTCNSLRSMFEPFFHGRSVLVRLTADGAQRVDDAMRTLAHREADELRGLSQEEQATLARLLRRLAEPE